jgi:hypothetical protein
MRKFILLGLVGLALALAAPQPGSAAPVVPGVIAATADHVSNMDQVRHRRWHHYRYWRYRHWRYRHWRYHHRWRYHRCWHHRHWSGRRCVWY